MLQKQQRVCFSHSELVDADDRYPDFNFGLLQVKPETFEDRSRAEIGDSVNALEGRQVLGLNNDALSSLSTPGLHIHNE
jgi:hypothetical protein